MLGRSDLVTISRAFSPRIVDRVDADSLNRLGPM